MIVFVILILVVQVVGRLSEYGSYVNPHPRPYERCEASDLIKLSNCCNDVLGKLDDCKSNDLACECCALQSINQACYSICPGNPSNNFLFQLYNDCKDLNDINACSLPFKKFDELPKKLNSEEEEASDSVIVKSKLSSTKDLEEELGTQEEDAQLELKQQDDSVPQIKSQAPSPSKDKSKAKAEANSLNGNLSRTNSTMNSTATSSSMNLNIYMSCCVGFMLILILNLAL